MSERASTHSLLAGASIAGTEAPRAARSSGRRVILRSAEMEDAATGRVIQVESTEQLGQVTVTEHHPGGFATITQVSSPELMFSIGAYVDRSFQSVRSPSNHRREFLARVHEEVLQRAEARRILASAGPSLDEILSPTYWTNEHHEEAARELLEEFGWWED